MLKITAGRALVFLAFAFLPACSSVEMKMPANRFDSPETRGQPLKVRADFLTLEGSNHVTVIEDYTRVPPRVDFPELSRSDINYMLGAGLSVLNQLDIEFKSPSSAPTSLGVKFQFLGEGATTAKRGNLSAAATLFGGYGADGGKATQFLGTVTSQFNMRVWSYDAALVTGFRADDPVLFFGGPFFSHYVVSGEVVQPAGGNTVYRFAGRGDQWGLNVGVGYDVGQFTFKVSEAWTHANFESQSISGFYTGIQTSVGF